MSEVLPRKSSTTLWVSAAMALPLLYLVIFPWTNDLARRMPYGIRYAWCVPWMWVCRHTPETGPVQAYSEWVWRVTRPTVQISEQYGPYINAD